LLYPAGNQSPAHLQELSPVVLGNDRDVLFRSDIAPRSQLYRGLPDSELGNDYFSATEETGPAAYRRGYASVHKGIRVWLGTPTP
jgi:hypothetical protein